MAKKTTLWSNEKVAAKLFDLRMQAAAEKNAAYVALLSKVLDRVEASI